MVLQRSCSICPSPRSFVYSTWILPMVPPIGTNRFGLKPRDNDLVHSDPAVLRGVDCTELLLTRCCGLVKRLGQGFECRANGQIGAQRLRHQRKALS